MIVLRLSVVHLIERKHSLFPLQPQSLIGLVNLLEMIIHIVMCFLDMSDVQSIIREGKSCSHSQNIVTWLSIRVCQVRYNIFFSKNGHHCNGQNGYSHWRRKNTTYAQLRIGDLKENLLFQTIQQKIDRSEASIFSSILNFGELRMFNLETEDKRIANLSNFKNMILMLVKEESQAYVLCFTLGSIQFLC